MGTSLKVAPVSDVLGHIPHTTPVILINKTPILHMATDIMLLGDCDYIVEYLCRRLGWPLPKIQPGEQVVGTPAAEQARERVEQHDEEDSKTDSGVKESSDAELKHPERLMNRYVANRMSSTHRSYTDTVSFDSRPTVTLGSSKVPSPAASQRSWPRCRPRVNRMMKTRTHPNSQLTVMLRLLSCRHPLHRRDRARTLQFEHTFELKDFMRTGLCVATVNEGCEETCALDHGCGVTAGIGTEIEAPDIGLDVMILG